MGSPALDTSRLPPHPTLRIRRRYYAFAGLFALLGLMSAGLGVAVFAPFMLVIAAYCAFVGWTVARYAREVQYSNLALERLTRGNVEEAEALLARIPPERDRGYVRRATSIQRGLIALQRGDAEAAIRITTASLEEPTSVLSRQQEETLMTAGRALRALAHASLGHEEEARRDAGAVESAATATAEAVARARLAESVVLARKKDLVGLAAQYGGGREAMVEYLAPRERALARAIRQMARARRTSVYREPAPRDETTEEGRIAGWIERVAPAAAAFAPTTAPHAESAPSAAPPSVSPEGLRAVKSARDSARRGMKKTRPLLVLGVLWGGLMVAFFAFEITSLPSVSRGGLASTASPFGVVATTLLVGVFAGALVLAVVLQVRRYRRFTERLAAAKLLAARGEERTALKEVSELTRAPLDVVGASAHLVLAQLAERRADWSGLVAACSDGIARATARGDVRAGSSDILIPELVGYRALGLAALGQNAEAAAELASLGSEYPSYPYAGRAQFRARLVSAVKRGDLAAAAGVALTRTLDMPLPVRDELLADLVVATTRGSSEKERERIDDEIAGDANVARWIDSLAPGLRSRPRVRVQLDAPPVAEPSVSLATEAEEDQASAEARAPRRARPS